MHAESEEKSSCSWVGVVFQFELSCCDRYEEGEQGESLRNLHEQRGENVGRFASSAFQATRNQELDSHLHSAIFGSILVHNAIRLFAV